jgi:molecular chaperone GrpE (heat shock protein)
MLNGLTAPRLTTALVAVALAATACGGTSSNASTPKSTPSQAASAAAMPAADPTSTDAAGLRAGLTLLFREHVNLTGFVVNTAVKDGLGSANTTQAVAALDANTVDLGDAIGSVYGDAAKVAFLKMWRAHIGFFVEYTKGLATKDNAMVAKAQTELAGYKKDFSEFLAGATKLPASAIAADLEGHVDTLETAIKAIVTNSPDAAAKLSEAAMHMDGTAAVLAKGIAAEKNLKGTSDGSGSTLRAALTGLFVQHVALTGEVVQVAVKDGLTSANTTQAVAALDANTVGIGDAIGSVYGDAAKVAFLKMWRAHIGFFVEYTKGLATKDNAMVAKAQTELAGYKKDFSEFLAGATKLPASAIAADLQGHVDTLEDAIKAIVTNSPDAGAKIRMAQSHMAGTAAVLSKGIAAEFPQKFS